MAVGTPGVVEGLRSILEGTGVAPIRESLDLAGQSLPDRAAQLQPIEPLDDGQWVVQPGE